jgi:subtilase family serine protease
VTIPAAYGQTKYSTHNCGYTPKQLRSAYGLSNYLNGGGQKVAIVGAYASPSIV